MKIAITTNTTDVGGAEKQRILLANALAARGHDVLLVVLQRPGVLHNLISASVQTEQIAFLRQLPKIYEVLLTGTTNTELAFGLLNRGGRRAGRWLTAVHNPVSARAPQLRRLSRVLVRLADARIALTPQHRSSLARYWRLNAEYVVPNASPPPRSAKRRAPQEKATGRLGYLGRIAIEHKGLDRLIRALQEDAAGQLRVEVAGSGPDVEALQQMIRESDLESRVSLMGFLEAEEFMRRIDGLVLLSRWEAQPMVLLEAAHAGLPVVRSKEIDLEVGVDADDPAAVAAALVELQAGRIAPELESVRDPDLMAADYETVFEAVKNTRRARVEEI